MSAEAGGMGTLAIAAAVAGGAGGIVAVTVFRPRLTAAVVALNASLFVVLAGGVLAIESLPFAAPVLAGNLVLAGCAGLVAASILAAREAARSDAAARAVTSAQEAARRTAATLDADNARLTDEVRAVRAKLAAVERQSESDSTRTGSGAHHRRALEAVKAIEKKQRAVFDGALEGMGMLERESLRLIDANHSLERLTGFTVAELAERTVFQLFADGPHRPTKADLQRAGRERRALRGELARKDGAPVFVDITLSVIGTGDETQLLVVLRDVTATHAAERDAEAQLAALAERDRRGAGPVKELEARVADALREVAELRRAAEEREHDVAVVSHELRTPLTSIGSFAEILLDHPDAERAVRDEFLGIIHKEAGRLTRLVNGILELARLEATGVALELSEFDVRSAVADSVGSVSGMAAGLEVSIAQSLGTRARPMRADRDRIQQLLVNLISNAVKFSPAGSEVRVEVLDGADAGTVRIDVIDVGPGIAAEDLPHVFEKFRRSAEAPSSGIDGTGLGLAICREIAGRHGGCVTVESALGVGSRFSVTLPVAAPAGGTAPAAHAKPKARVHVEEAIPVVDPVSVPLDEAPPAPRPRRIEPAAPRRALTVTEPAARRAESGVAWSTTGSLPPLRPATQTSHRDTNSATGELPPIR